MSHKWTRGQIAPRNDALKATNGSLRPQGGDGRGETLAVGIAVLAIFAVVYGALYLIGGGR
jgi:hypothetical protein